MTPPLARRIGCTAAILVGVSMAAGTAVAQSDQRPPKPESSFACSRFALAYNEQKRTWECVTKRGGRVAVDSRGVPRRPTGSDARTDQQIRAVQQRTNSLTQEASRRLDDQHQDVLERLREPAQRTEALRQAVRQRTIQLVREAEDRRQEIRQRIEEQQREARQRTQELLREQRQRLRDLQNN